MQLPWRRKIEDRALARETTQPSFSPIFGPSDVGPIDALGISDVFACVRALADTAACLPLVPYRRLADGSRERITSGALPDLLDRPAPATSQANLIGTLVAHLNLHGKAFVGKYRDGGGQVSQIAALDPTGIVVELEAGEPKYTRYSSNGTTEHTAADIVHIRGLSLDGVDGISPIGHARMATELAHDLSSHASSFARNSGRLGGILRIGSLADADATRADLDSEIGTPEQSGRILMLRGGQAGDVDFVPMTMSLVDAQFVEQRNLSTAEIARIFRVPPWIIGAPSGDSMTYANVEQQAQGFVTFSLLPWLRVIEQAISNDPDLVPPRSFVEFLVDGLLRSDAATRASVYTAALNPVTGWMQRAEVRRLENLEPEPEEPPRPPILTPQSAPPQNTNGGAPDGPEQQAPMRPA